MRLFSLFEVTAAVITKLYQLVPKLKKHLKNADHWKVTTVVKVFGPQLECVNLKRVILTVITGGWEGGPGELIHTF